MKQKSEKRSLRQEKTKETAAKKWEISTLKKKMKGFCRKNH